MKRRILSVSPAPAGLYACWNEDGTPCRERVAALAVIEDTDGQWVMGMVPGFYGCLDFLEDIGKEETHIEWADDDPPAKSGGCACSTTCAKP